jgi:hypothetical protein
MCLFSLYTRTPHRPARPPDAGYALVWNVCLVLVRIDRNAGIFCTHSVFLRCIVDNLLAAHARRRHHRSRHTGSNTTLASSSRGQLVFEML